MEPGSIREIKSIGNQSRSYRRHVHEEHSLALVRSGSSMAQIGGKDVPISTECVVVIPAGVPHACNPLRPGDWTYTLFLLDPEAVSGGPDFRLFQGSHRVLPSSPRIKMTFRSLEESGNGSEDALVDLLLVLEGTAFRDDTGSGPERRPAPPALVRVRELLGERLSSSSLNLEELSAVSGLSKFHLVRSFKECYGLTPHAYLMNLRVNEAKMRLRSGEPLSEAALDCGFCDQSHFTRVFESRVGMTPAAYREVTAISYKTRIRR
jgi:AraC-like DNA-binding protein